MTLAKTYDYLNRLGSIVSTPSASSAVGYRYNYNNANQRTRATLADGSYWKYEYDQLGQVKSGKRYWNDHTPVAGQQFEYTFDDIGNRESTKAGGNSSGSSLRTASYTANELNQIIERDVPGGIDVLGAGRGTVTVNSLSTYRKGEYYYKELSVANTMDAVWQSVSVDASEGGSPTNIAGHVFVPETPESCSYDVDGNLASDGRWTYTWDGENRLRQIESHSGLHDDSKRKIEFAYDWQGRRIGKTSYLWVSGSWSNSSNQKYLYDGWNLVGVLDGSNTLLQSFCWGSDLSGTIDGAGGVGGLISMTVHTGANSGVYFYNYDGNGNIVGLVNSVNGQTVAQYEYGPFGELIRATGSLARENSFCFSTKFQDHETGFLYYGYRFYISWTGRWPNRDPIGEVGFEGNKYFTFTKDDLQNLAALDPEDENLDALEAAQNNILFAAGKTAYVMVNNDPVSKTDLYGLVCNVVANRTKAPMSSGLINAGHEWIVYGGNSVGFWPNRGYVVLRPDPGQTTPFPINWQWETEQKKSGTIKWGAAAGKSCACVTCADILASLDAAPNPGWHSISIRNNCRRFVKWAFDGSCLKKGKKT